MSADDKKTNKKDIELKLEENQTAIIFSPEGYHVVCGTRLDRDDDYELPESFATAMGMLELLRLDVTEIVELCGSRIKMREEMRIALEKELELERRVNAARAH